MPTSGDGRSTARPSPERSKGSRSRSGTLTGRPAPSSTTKTHSSHPSIDSTHGAIEFTTSSSSAATQALSNIQAGPPKSRPPPILTAPAPQLYPDAPPPTAVPSTTGLGAPISISPNESEEGLFPPERAILALYTYKATGSSLTPASSQPSPLPSTSLNAPPSAVRFSYQSLPFKVEPGDYLEIRGIRPKHRERVKGEEKSHTPKSGGEALKGVPKYIGRDGFVFRIGDDVNNVPLHQIQVPESVAHAFRLQHRGDVEIIKISDSSEAYIDHVELRFSQYLGRADMWRLGMSLEQSTIHVGEKINLAGGAIRAEVHAIYRGGDRYSSGIFTSKTKTIYRSKSAQVYVFVQLCAETWQFDEDGERYYEKVVHGLLPDLFARWSKRGTSHLVTIILFGRILYHNGEISYLEKNDLTAGLSKDYAGRWCKDFFRVVIDFERRSDWQYSLPEIKRRLEASEREILMEFHREMLEKNGDHDSVQKRLLGKWSFAYEGNVLEAVNLALNPFDEHYIDRDLSRTGLTMMIVTPGTGHFAVDKNLLRLTTERMVDHGFSLDLICLTKMPLHSVPLFSYVTRKPKKLENGGFSRAPTATPDLLYFDAVFLRETDVELADCYSIPKWVNASFYSRTADKPFRNDRFIARCKMYEIQMLGILDHNLTTVTVPLLEIEDNERSVRMGTADERKKIRDDFDSVTFGYKPEPKASAVPSPPSGGSKPGSVVASYQSARLLASLKTEKLEIERLVEARKAEDITEGLFGLRRGTTISTSPSKSPKNLKIGWSPTKTPHKLLTDLPKEDTQDTPRSDPRATSPAPSILSLRRNIGLETSPSRSSTLPNGDVLGNGDTNSGQSTPKVTPGKKLKTQASKGSLGRFKPSWFMGTLTSRSQVSAPIPAIETVERRDVIQSGRAGGTRSPSPVSMKRAQLPPPLIVPTGSVVEVQPPTPSPHKIARPITASNATQPVPILSKKRLPDDPTGEPVKSLRNSHKVSRSPNNPESWGRSADLGRASRHVTVNPCNPTKNIDPAILEGRRWQHIRPKAGLDDQHLMKWTSLCTPACFPLTTDYLPTLRELQEFYSINSYEITTFQEQISSFIRLDAASQNLALAVMREMASQRLSQNFQYIVLPHDTASKTAELNKAPHRKILASGESMSDDLKIGGASEALRDPDGSIYLLLSHHIHRLSCDTHKQSVTVQKFVRNIKYSTNPVMYKCLVWPANMSGYQQAEATFKYPNIESKLGFNYLDRLINGDEHQLNEKIQYWRTRYILIPSGKDPSSNIAAIMPKGDTFQPYEILMEGAYKVLDVFNKACLKRSNPYYPASSPSTVKKDDKPLKLIGTSFDPSACVLDEGLMNERERLFADDEVIEKGKRLEGMTLAQVAEMMCKERNGLIIRDRLWGFSVHEDSFTGEQFCEWLSRTFEDVKSPEQSADWGRSLLDKGLIEHVTESHKFYNYGHFYYRLRPAYDKNAKKRRILSSWFHSSTSTAASEVTSPNSSSPLDAREVIERHAKLSYSPQTPNSGDKASGLKQQMKGKKRKIRMSQSVIIDLDPSKRSDRAEVAVLHADIIHCHRNALHFELNWLGVTAGLLEDLRQRCAAQAERYGLRFVEAPVEQIADINKKCAYRAAIPIPLALEPPVISDLSSRLSHIDQNTGNIANWFEYKILTDKFGFILDVEAASRYPETIEVEYIYRKEEKFAYSQFCHKSGLSLVQCIGGKEGFLWSDNRLYISSPGRAGRSAGETQGGAYPNMPVARYSRGEEAKLLREAMERFCNDKAELEKFYDEITPPPIEDLEGMLSEKAVEIKVKEG